MRKKGRVGDVTTVRGGLVCRVTSKEETRSLRAQDRSEYRKRIQQNVGARATKHNASVIR
jgi:hypothetical protein